MRAWWTPEQRARIGAKLKGHAFSPERRAKIAAKARARYADIAERTRQRRIRMNPTIIGDCAYCGDQATV
jgi:hypothetical protein